MGSTDYWAVLDSTFHQKLGFLLFFLRRDHIRTIITLFKTMGIVVIKDRLKDRAGKPEVVDILLYFGYLNSQIEAQMCCRQPTPRPGLAHVALHPKS